MVYLFQTFIKDNKSLQMGLQKLFGIGSKSSKKIAESLGVCAKTRLDQLGQYQIQRLKRAILHEYDVGSSLEQRLLSNINRLVLISSYRGFRHIENLPTRGQRTHDNARTVRKLLKLNSSKIGRQNTNKPQKKNLSMLKPRKKQS